MSPTVTEERVREILLDMLTDYVVMQNADMNADRIRASFKADWDRFQLSLSRGGQSDA